MVGSSHRGSAWFECKRKTTRTAEEGNGNLECPPFLIPADDFSLIVNSRNLRPFLVMIESYVRHGTNLLRRWFLSLPCYSELVPLSYHLILMPAFVTPISWQVAR